MPSREMAEGIKSGGSVAPEITARGFLKIPQRDLRQHQMADSTLVLARRAVT